VVVTVVIWGIEGQDYLNLVQFKPNQVESYEANSLHSNPNHLSPLVPIPSMSPPPSTPSYLPTYPRLLVV